ncbi:cystathionine beta-synthase (CBS) family protein [Actinidia rufa]|uniref:Cystathionine beta-synthase (CBS) family protein n=1 Tax=Actinidia rufa TaxID=165716 RepID=A0A7J0FSX6_9ERIC|nr:cystathionine beta-synthase (CBS) family protein [Actinidia rufa]
MFGGIQKVLSHGGVLKNAVLQHIRLVNPVMPVMRPLLFPRYESTSPARIEEHGFESTTIADILKGKGKNADGSWLWCTTDDTVYDAVQSNKLITVTPGTKVLKAMQLMTDKRIRHIPVIDDMGMIGMVSIGDVVRAVVSEHREELDRLNAYIHGGY